MAVVTLSRSSTPPCIRGVLLSLTTIPDELILHILSFLDVPELLHTSRTTHRLRHLSLDPLLHAARLNRASLTIERSIPCRPPLELLVRNRVYVSSNSAAARRLNWNLIKIKLNRALAHRPPASRLVERGVLPDEYVHGRLAPTLISTKRRIEREKVKDVLRGWVEEWRKRGGERAVVGEGESRPNVRILVRRFGKGGEVGLGRGVGMGSREAPTRATVAGLTRFWEHKGREGGIDF